MNVYPLIVYCILLGIALLMSFLKYKNVNIVVLCFGLYFICSLTSIYFFYNTNYNYSNLQILPFIYVFGCILLTMIPIVKYENYENKFLETNRGAYRIISYSLLFFSIISIEPFIENIIHLPTVLHNQSSLSDIYEARAEGNAGKDEYLSWIGRKLFWINFLLKDVISIVFFYYIAKWEQLDKKILIGMALGILNPLIHGFELGGRSSIVNTFIYLIFAYFLFRPFIAKKRNKIVDKLLLFCIAGLVVAMSIITMARFLSDDHSVDIWTWVSLYTGEGVLNFSSDLWPVDKTCNGDNTFLFIRYLLGLTNNVDLDSLRSTRDILGVRNMVFYTYIGTIYYDYNKIGTIVFIAVFSWLFCYVTKVKNGVVRLSQLIYLSILGKVIMMGIMFYPYANWTDQVALFLMLLFTWLLNYNESHSSILNKRCQ